MLVLPENLAKRKPPFGKVVMKGSGNKKSRRHKQDSFLMDDIELGDYVRCDTNFGSEDVLFNGEPHRIVSIMDVQMVIPQDMAVVNIEDLTKQKPHHAKGPVGQLVSRNMVPSPGQGI